MCKARIYSDQYICDSCGLQWDVNDPDPPVCPVDPIDKLIGSSESFSDVLEKVSGQSRKPIQLTLPFKSDSNAN